jgi:hypothetical protein
MNGTIVLSHVPILKVIYVILAAAEKNSPVASSRATEIWLPL